MCIAAIAINQHPHYPVIVASNRDEFVVRPTLALLRWSGDSGIIAGRDLQAGGTWLGVNRHGWVALVTNFRDPSERKADAQSRGELVVQALSAGKNETPATVARRIQEAANAYQGFNFALVALGEVWVVEGRSATIRQLGEGVHVVSNGPFEAPWPKCARLRERVSAAITLAPAESLADALLQALDDPLRAPPEALPSTGISHAMEHALSAVRIRGLAHYGTRTSTVLLQNGEHTRIDALEHVAASDAPAGDRRTLHSKAEPRGA
jgi:uncharacterized protein with NRDE domain